MEPHKILVVDDDKDIMETIRFSLLKAGYEVITATDGWEALGAIRSTEPDLVVLDVMLPKENGYRVSRTIKEDEEAGRFSRKIPIILLTARDLSKDPEREKMFIDFSRADDFIYKPFDMSELLKRIEEMLMNSQ